MHLGSPKSVLSWLAIMTLGIGAHASTGRVAAAFLGCVALGVVLFGDHPEPHRRISATHHQTLTRTRVLPMGDRIARPISPQLGLVPLRSIRSMMYANASMRYGAPRKADRSPTIPP